MTRAQDATCAMQVLEYCSAHFSNPTHFDNDDPQRVIDIAIDNATKIVAARCAQLEAELVQARVTCVKREQSYDDMRRLYTERDTQYVAAESELVKMREALCQLTGQLEIVVHYIGDEPLSGVHVKDGYLAAQALRAIKALSPSSGDKDTQKEK
jgi:hypothetical protein